MFDEGCSMSCALSSMSYKYIDMATKEHIPYDRLCPYYKPVIGEIVLDKTNKAWKVKSIITQGESFHGIILVKKTENKIEFNQYWK